MARSIKNHKVSYENKKKKKYSISIASSFIKSEECSPFLRLMLDYELVSMKKKTSSPKVVHTRLPWHRKTLLSFPSTC